MSAGTSGVGGDARPLVTILVDDVAVPARAGEMLTTALARNGLLRLRRSPKAGGPRGAFCHMGVCQECALHVDGVLRQACLTPVREGLTVERRGVL
ncbi:(2Fe-2S)-binding protein [Aquabacter sediminis]|uniref:(2Fe-2S)-binding protein n=1 Tax=Aquabacter sediminis TaxID=3029197 RepID=UPI00237E6E42|nr:(2Fe-2S)-binding protein [Aquabacter sp. P-9]MDE1568863.1 (2Fe-2S)-binding protein [Aquabacter sp. P-9]